MKTTYNIGLNNNIYVERYKSEYKKERIERFFSSMSVLGVFTRVRFGTGHWDGDEPTAILVIVSDDEFDAEGICKNLCKLMTQTAIAMRTDGEEGKLIYHPDHKGEKYDFDEKYFIEF
ncbi:MAG: hypothetical protein ACK5XN_22670 [Bacteroidota bacterium]